MAETVAPSVRGRARMLVSVILVTSTAATAALFGALSGSLWEVAGLRPFGVEIVVAAGCVALVADRMRIAPPSVRKQVPQIWGRLFSPPVVAFVYGTRLGVGPLTILNTSLWWAAAVSGASGGAAVGAAVGATFGVVRAGAMLVARDRLARVPA